MKVQDLQKLAASWPASMPKIQAEYEPLIQDSLRYLSSSEALASIAADPYWPKWHSPWWHMLLLHEMGETKRIPEVAIQAMVKKLSEYPVKIFPIHQHEMPEGCDPYRHVPCHCQVGNIYQILATYGVNVDQELPWIRPWFLRYQMADGGLNCDSDAYLVSDECPSSMVGTIAAFEAVLLHTPRPWTTEEIAFLDRGAQFLIDRKLMLGSRTKHNADERDDEGKWLKPCFPRFYLYDVLRGLTALLSWAEKTNRSLTAEAVTGAVAHLSKQFLDGVVNTERTCFEGVGTILPTSSGDWIRRQPATFFPLLEEISKVGRASPHLTSRWTEARQSVTRLLEKQTFVDSDAGRDSSKNGLA